MAGRQSFGDEGLGNITDFFGGVGGGLGVASDIFGNVLSGLQFQEQKRQFGKKFGLEKKRFGIEKEEFDLGKAATLTDLSKGFEQTDWKNRFRRALQ